MTAEDKLKDRCTLVKSSVLECEMCGSRNTVTAQVIRKDINLLRVCSLCAKILRTIAEHPNGEVYIPYK